MSEPGFRRFGEDLSPTFSLYVQDIELQQDVTRYIKSVEFESTIEMADLIDLTILNPNFAVSHEKNWLNYKGFAEGNEAELWMGYGRADHFIGRAIFQKHFPMFPAEDIPTLKVKGYDKSFLMMDASGPLKGAKENKIKLVEQSPKDKKDNQGKSWVELKHSTVVEQVARKYAMHPDIDATTKVDTMVQKKGMKDYDLVKTLANLNQREFWVDYRQAHGWTLHWKKSNDTASPVYDFKYNAGAATTLLTLEPEYGIQGAITNLLVLAWSEQREEWVSVVELENVEGENPIFKKGQSGKKGSNSAILNETLESANQFRFSAAGVAIDIISNHQFKDLDSLARFARGWFLDQKDNFMIVKGTVVGVETLLSRQVHNLTGTGCKRIDGPFYFIVVRHKQSDGGYVCEFTARKIIE